MPPFRLVSPILGLLACVLPLHPQILVDTYAGGKIRAGVPAQDVAVSSIAGLAWDAAGNLVYCDLDANIIRRIRPDGILETLAGNGTTGFSGDGGPALAAALNQPQHPTFDGRGNLYFFDSGNSRIRRVDAKGVITSVAGSGLPYWTGMDLEGPALERSLYFIASLAADTAGNLYFTEQSSTVVRRVTTGGRIEIFAGVPQPSCYPCGLSGDEGPARQAVFADPTLLATDAAGNLYVVDRLPGDRIRRIGPDGIVHAFAGYGGPSAQQTPNDGQTALGVSFYSIGGLAADGAGNLYLIDGSAPYHGLATRIRAIDAGGIIHTIAGGTYGQGAPDGPALPSNINPAWLASSAGGNVAFVDSQPAPGGVASTLREVTPQATLKTLGGANPKPAPDGTPLREAWFLNAGAIALNRAGEILVAETGNCAIRRLGANGLLATVAGTGKCAQPIPAQPNTTPDLTPPASLAVDSQNRIYFLDSGGNSYVIGTDGKIAATGFPPSLGPGKLAIDGKDRVYVMGQFGLNRATPGGKSESIVGLPTTPGPQPVGSGPDLLRAIGTDPAGNVYFTGQFVGDIADSVFRVNDDGTFTRILTGLYNELSLAADGNGNFWLAAGWVFLRNAAGGASLSRDMGYSGDGGPAVSARFNATAIVRKPSGEIYVLDGGRIRVLSGTEPANAPSIAPGGIVNAASLTGGPIAPGELLSIFGSNFGVTALVANPVENNRLPYAFGRVKVLFNGYEGNIVAMTATQINVFASTLIEAGKTADVVVQVDGVLSAPVTMPVAASAFGLSTADQSGAGPGAILNQDGSVNSAANPAPRGSVVSLFGTGEGHVTPYLFAGAFSISTPYSTPDLPVTVTIGGVPAEVLYAGEAPLLPAGVLQINARIPAGISAGAASVSVSIGGIPTSRAVTVAVR